MMLSADRSKISLALTWGSTAAERELVFPCDTHLEEIDTVAFRAIDVRAPVETVFRWLCQLKVAPYSYDWLDNGGRRSPRRLTPGAEQLARGQRMMGTFRISDFKRDVHITLVQDAPRAALVLGDAAVSYMVFPTSKGSSRLIVKVRFRFPRKPWGALARMLLPWGDLVMMRKQLLNLKGLAESQAS